MDDRNINGGFNHNDGQNNNGQINAGGYDMNASGNDRYESQGYSYYRNNQGGEQQGFGYQSYNSYNEYRNDSSGTGDGEKKNKKDKKRFKSYPSYAIISLTSGIIGALVFASVFSIGDKFIGNSSNQPQKNITIAASEDMNVPQAVAEKTMDSVVGITTKEVREQNDLFMGTTQQVVEGVGSGVVVSSDGYILTNSHVISNGNAQDIKVLFKDGSEKEASIVWHDDSLDLAVIKVDAKNLKPAELGDSDKVKIGETAVAIGNPLGLDFERTVTSGIVSGLNRSIDMSENSRMEGLMQTDASINSGNSGGPLLNSKGQVIGINTLKIQSSEGMGFAQPINIAKPVIQEIIKKGAFESGYLGIYGEDVQKYQKSTGRDFGTESGTLVTGVVEGSPAEKAGMAAGDVITAVNGEKVDSFQGLKKALYKFKPGQKVTLTVVKDKKEKKIDITLSSSKMSLS